MNAIDELKLTEFETVMNELLSNEKLAEVGLMLLKLGWTIDCEVKFMHSADGEYEEEGLAVGWHSEGEKMWR